MQGNIGLMQRSIGGAAVWFGAGGGGGGGGGVVIGSTAVRGEGRVFEYLSI